MLWGFSTAYLLREKERERENVIITWYGCVVLLDFSHHKFVGEESRGKWRCKIWWNKGWKLFLIIEFKFLIFLSKSPPLDSLSFIEFISRETETKVLSSHDFSSGLSYWVHYVVKMEVKFMNKKIWSKYRQNITYNL